MKRKVELKIETRMGYLQWWSKFTRGTKLPNQNLAP